MTRWLESGAALLAEPDPGPTQFLVEQLIVDPSILAVVGSHKVGKTWALLDLALSIVTGLPAFGSLEVRRGPVILVLEESGRTALHRRLSQLCRGRGIKASEIEHLHFAANQRVRLVDGASGDSWPQRIRAAVAEIRPAAVFFDPLARVKGLLDENDQREMTPALEFMRELRDLGQCTVGFVQHEGHNERGRMRGTSDFEAFWESKVKVRREGDRCELSAEHREAEPSERISYRLDFDAETRSLRLEADDNRSPAVRDEVLDYLREHPGSTFPELRDGVGRRKEHCRSELLALEKAGTVDRRETRRPDRKGTLRRADAFYLSPEAGSTEVPAHGTATDRNGSGPMEVPGSHLFKSGTRTPDGAVEAGSSLPQPAGTAPQEAPRS